MLAALLLAASCTVPPALAVPRDGLSLTAGVEILHDPQRGLTLDAVRTEPNCRRFAAHHGEPNFGVRPGGLWLRLRPQLAGDGWRLAVRFTGLERACAYWPLQGGGTFADCISRSDPQQRPRWLGGRLLFDVPEALDLREPVHLYVDSQLWLKAPLELSPAAVLQERESAAEYGWGLYYGLLAAFVAVSLIFYFGRRDRAFLLFGLHLAALTLALAVWQGRFAGWEPAGWNFTRLLPVLVALFLMLGVRFYQQFLQTRRHGRRVHAALTVCFWAALAGGLLAVPWPVAGTQALGPITLFWLGCVVWAALARARARYWPAVWVLAAVASLLIAIFLNALSVAGIWLLPADQVLQMAYAGNLIAAGFLVFGLVYRVRMLADERDRATELAAANRNLALYRAHFDELTHLPNRSKFSEDAQERLLAGRPAALVILGLDRFRAINHALGHEGGDGVLIESAGRLRQAAGAGELLARIGPATFALLTDASEGLEERCAQLRRALTAPLLRGRGATLSLSIGVALYPRHAATAEALLRCADEAYYRAREEGTPFRVFDPRDHQHAERYLDLNKDLRHALGHDELELHYQPLCALDSGALLGVEALLRWPRHAADTPVEQVIAVAEASDLIGPLTDWVFRRACRQARDWRARGVPVPMLGVNVSALQFRLPNFAERLLDTLAEFELPGQMLALEITESLMLGDTAATRATLQRLRDRGLTLAVDDFGVGYSSLNYLRRLPVQSVKIDRSFLHGVPHQAEAVSVINAIITLGRDLNLLVVAEGIETQAQYDFLLKRGVSAGQGYWLARPLPAADLERWLDGREAAAA